MPRPTPDVPGPGQESVWDYPRPPRIERTGRRIQIVLGGVPIVDSTRALRVLETSHPPTYYVPPEDVLHGVLSEVPDKRSLCEWKGEAHYYDVRAGGRRAAAAAWAYPEPIESSGMLPGFVAFYAQAMDECRVDGELVTPQPGGFYGGWITSHVVGPFKGEPGSWGW